MKKHYVIHTKPKQEDKVLFNLKRQGFQTWSPMYKKTLKLKSKILIKTEHFFPGYIFVILDLCKDNWSKIQNTYGVKYLISIDGKPKALEDSILLTLKKIVENQFLEIDDTVEVTSGKLVSKKGKIIELCNSDRVKLLLESISGRITAILQKNILCKI